MSASKEGNKDKKDKKVVRSAADRIASLEQGMLGSAQLHEETLNELGQMRSALMLLNNKVDSMVTLSSQGSDINNETLNAIMTDNNVRTLASRVEDMKEGGFITETKEVRPNTMLVGRELSTEGDKVVNPRMQFILEEMDEGVQKKLIGKKPGDIVKLQEGKLLFELSEVYDLVPPEDLEKQEEATKT